MSDPAELPLLSQAPNPDRDTAEVRIRIPLQYASALDALASIDDSNRTALVETAVKEYLDRRLYNARVLVRMFDGNPSTLDSRG